MTTLEIDRAEIKRFVETADISTLKEIKNLLKNLMKREESDDEYYCVDLTEEDIKGIERGREDIRNGRFVTSEELHNEVEKLFTSWK